MPWLRVGVQGGLKVWFLGDVFVMLPVVPRGHSLGAWGLGCHRLSVTGVGFAGCSEFEGGSFLLAGFLVFLGDLLLHLLRWR